MNLKSTLLTLGLFIPVSVFADVICVTVDGSGEKNGSNWENAMAFTTFCESVGASDGNEYHFAVGTYKPAAQIAITKAVRLLGGYDPTTDETSLTERTVFSGDMNNSSVADDGDLQNIINIKNAADAAVVIRGIDFTSVYYDGTNKDAEYGALYMELCNKVTVRDCKFYGNVAAKEGGIAVRSKTTVARFLECSFYDNKANSHGAAVRMNSGKNNVGSVTFERCIFTDNSVNSGTGSAICVQHCKSLNIINSLIANNIAGEGGAVFVNGKNTSYNNALCVVNSTIAGNNHNQIFFNQSAGNLKIVNSIVVGNNDNGTKEEMAIIGSVAATTVSGGYNMLGTCPAGFPQKDSDMFGLIDDNYAEYFADADFVAGIADGKIPNGASVSEIKAAVAGWGIDANVGFEVDVNNTPRGLTIPGAVKADALPTTIKVGEAKVATYYNNVYGYTMPKGLTGYTITGTSGNKIVVNAKYQAGANVPKGAALLIAGEPNEYAFAFKLAETDNQDNLLKGTQEEKDVTAETGKCIYKLANDTERGLGFYWGSPDGKTLNNKANKCYLELDETTASAKPYFIIGTITGISNVDTDKPADDGFYYTLSGIRVVNPRGGIYIKNGKKVIIK